MAYQLFRLPKSTNIGTSSFRLEAGAKAYFYATGTTTPQNTYQDSGLLFANANPVVADSAGVLGAIYLDPSLSYKLTLKTSADVLIYTVDPVNDALLDADFIGRALYATTAAETAAGVTPVDFQYPPYNLLRYGGVGDNSTFNDTPFANWKLACNQADAEGLIPEGTFKISADIQLPKKVKCCGSITGAFYVRYEKYTHGWITGLACTNFFLRGCIWCTVENLFCQYANIDGYSSSYGVFWNEFIQWNVDKTLTIDITNWAVNSNAWRGGRIGYMHITGTLATYAGTQAHSNTFSAVDFTDYGNTPSGILQDDSAFQINYLYGCYFEGGGTLNGNFHIWGMQGDATGMPPIARFAHIMGVVGLNSRLSRDFLSLSVNNCARGGNWDWLDTSGKPPCLSQSGGAGPAVTVDTSEPGGVGKRYEATFSAAFSGFSITMQPNGTDRFGLTVYYRSTGDFAAIESNDGSGAISQSVNVVTADTNWKMLRICGPASKTTTTSVTLYAYGGGGGSAKFMAIGSIFAGGERAVIAPHKNQDYESGIYTPTLTGVTNIAASTAYAMQWQRVGNTVTVGGRLDVDPTLAAPTPSEIGISLPLAPYTAFTVANNCNGTGASLDNGQCGPILADVANARATLRFKATNTANDSWGVSFSYRLA